MISKEMTLQPYAHTRPGKERRDRLEPKANEPRWAREKGNRESLRTNAVTRDFTFSRMLGTGEQNLTHVLHIPAHITIGSV